MIHPKALDSDDPSDVVGCLEAEYDCAVLRSKQRSSGLYLTIRSGSDSMPTRLLRDLRSAGYTPLTMHNTPRDGEYQLEATFAPRGEGE